MPSSSPRAVPCGRKLHNAAANCPRLVGAAPLVAGALIPVEAVLDGPTLCPFQLATGAPCPLCGATRAFVLFGHADGRWLDYGAVWVVVALALIALGVARRRITVWALPVVGALAWAWALAHAGAITS